MNKKQFLKRIINHLRKNWHFYLFFFMIKLPTVWLILMSEKSLLGIAAALLYFGIMVCAKISGGKRRFRDLLLCISLIVYFGSMLYFKPPTFYLNIAIFHLILTYSFLFNNPLFSLVHAVFSIYLFVTYDPSLRNNIMGIVTQSLAYNTIAMFVKKQDKDKKRLRKLSITDTLTQTATLGYILELGKKYLAEGYPLATIIIDLNNFKQINDTYGHIVGNNALIQVANLLKEQARDFKGVVGRLGGDEFVILIKKAALHKVEDFMVELNNKLNTEKFILDPDIEPMTLSFAIGKAESHSLPDDSITIETLLYNADIDMYYNKYGNERKNLYSNYEKYNFPFEIHHLLSVMAEKDIYTYVHSEHTAHYSVMLAKKIGLPDSTIQDIFVAAWLHDIGKLLISNNILRKTGRLNDKEFYIISKHPQNGINILSNYHLSEVTKNAILYHHEKFNGKGYPGKFTESDIPLEARILKIADSYTAMIIKRLYRKSLTSKEALDEIKRCSGTDFDPELVNEFITLFNSKKPNNIDVQIKKWIEELKNSLLNNNEIVESYI